MGSRCCRRPRSPSGTGCDCFQIRCQHFHWNRRKYHRDMAADYCQRFLQGLPKRFRNRDLQFLAGLALTKADHRAVIPFRRKLENISFAFANERAKQRRKRHRRTPCSCCLSDERGNLLVRPELLTRRSGAHTRILGRIFVDKTFVNAEPKKYDAGVDQQLLINQSTVTSRGPAPISVATA